MTWLLVKMKPSGVITNPDPLPATSRGRFLTRCSISMFTTAGATRATALTTEREYSSSNKSSVETSFLLVNPEPFCGFGSPNRLIAVGSSCSDTAKSLVIISRKRSTKLTCRQLLSSYYYTSCLDRYSLLAPDLVTV